MTTYEAISLLIQLSAVILATFSIVVTLIIFFIKKK
ncbi:putative holin-like toxin [Psychrobacillus psychrodurans]|nr:putative holin-like toxin [Psychrobacillus psychrodurans]MCZ8541357.1 putative holin-like toxin [Psychrobacillus psychrodurans]